MLGRDGIAGLVCLALSIGMYSLTFGLPPASMVPVGPAFYPRVVILILGILSAILIVLDIRARRRVRAGTATVPAATAAASTAGPGPNYRLVLATFIEFGLYIALLPPFGFRIATFVFVLALQVTLEWPQSNKRWALAVLIAVATTVVSYLVFENYLQVLLPRGTWSGM
jgi:hypothetical protein